MIKGRAEHGEVRIVQAPCEGISQLGHIVEEV